MRLIIVRHGEPDYKNDCLTEEGSKQAKKVAKRLLSEGIEEIWSSPLGRAYETAKETADLLNLPIQTLDFMREISWGSKDDTPLFKDGHPWDIVDEMARRGENLNAADWRSHPFFINNRVLESVDWIEPSIDEWLKRFSYEREGLYYRHTAEEEKHRTIALFCHGGSSSVAIGHILNLPFPYVCAMLHMDFTAITTLRFDRHRGPCTLPCLERANDQNHIDGSAGD